MTGVITALESKTIWAGLLVLVSAVIGAFGYHVSATDQADVLGLVSTIGATLGGVAAIYGRIKATKVIGATPAPGVTAAGIAEAVAAAVGPAIAAALAAQAQNTAQ